MKERKRRRHVKEQEQTNLRICNKWSAAATKNQNGGGDRGAALHPRIFPHSFRLPAFNLLLLFSGSATSRHRGSGNRWGVAGCAPLKHRRLRQRRGSCDPDGETRHTSPFLAVAAAETGTPTGCLPFIFPYRLPSSAAGFGDFFFFFLSFSFVSSPTRRHQ